MKIEVRFLIILILLLITNFSAQNIKINEIVSSNLNSLKDEDNENPDWIELYNSGNSAVNLLHYGLSDDIDEPHRWSFPDISIQPNDYLVVFASGKDRAYNPYWQTIIDWEDNWRYFVGTQPPPTNWRQLNFNDNNWEYGPSGFGYGDDDDATEIWEISQEEALSVYIRKTFDIDNVNDVLTGLLHIDFDDAFVAWMNEVEIARENIGYIGNFPAYYDTVDIRTHEAELYRDGRPNHYIIENIQSILQNGENVLTIQTNTLDSDMTMIPFLTLGFATEPSDTLYVSPIVEPNLLNLHTDFSLNENEPVILSDPAGNIIDQLEPGFIPLDNSFGRQPDGSNNLFFFESTSPDSTNDNSISSQDFADPPDFFIDGGIFDNSVNVSFVGIPSGATVYYTIDGSEPNPDSTDTFEYTYPVNIDTTTVVRAQTYQPGYLPSKLISNTYLIAENHTLPVVSLTTDPYNLWDYYEGIYAKGPNAGSGFPYLRANFWQDWERPVHIELFEPDGNLGFKMDGGIKIFGYFSRGHDQKSVAVFARSKYGTGMIPYKFFEDKPFTEYKNIVFRNSGGDWMRSMMRDGFMQSLLKDTGLSYQSYRPAVIYLNGVYWGIQNIRQKVNEHFFAQTYGADPDNIDLLEENRQVLYGTVTAYSQFMDFIDTHDLNIPANYEQLETMMDIDNYLSYQVAEIMFCNTDWPGRNIKYWRERTPDAKWRWQIFDLDLGLGLINSANHNTLAFALRENGPYYPNPDWSTYLFRRMVESDQFVVSLVNKFADFMNSIFDPGYLEAKIDSNYAYLEIEMVRHFNRWEYDNYNFDNWSENEHLVMAYFARDRKAYMTQYIKQQFDIPGIFSLNLTMLPENSGTVKVNSLEIEDMQWSGDYFDNIPITLTAIPKPGYIFSGWTGAVESDSLTIQISSQYDVDISANFIIGIPEVSNLVINEINYNSSDTFDPNDWIEIYNPKDSAVYLDDWNLKDDDNSHNFTFPPIYLASHDYLVLCRDLTAFNSHFPDVQNIIGNFDFGLSSNGDMVRLYKNNTLIDSLLYSSQTPWPVEPDGTGPTLSLKNPLLDNSLAENWAASDFNGTPGAKNEDVYEPLNPPLSDKLQLLQNYPNPFIENTVIKYSIPTEGRVKIKLYNLRGQAITTLVNEIRPEGTYTAIWSGRDKYDRKVSSGLYFYKLSHNGKTKVKKMLVVR
ncbi:MAG: CotH kinase family protein [Candidatus Cloacimonetes bacterium]|nr:CotH kinase family protein [Candidatus Cloacimonadota bacterium]MCF7814615.1 CotH kinase family protein [Candidatus Cloacimonadota bacterium]MCF7868113.1 CotH kinase family protein [Candidatus Cloacimonadota bacterium]MCF7883579.1 CotH kinase family protein [Candidatus Cloacimonadota bacterium]